jgi:hypothetical protein
MTSIEKHWRHGRDGRDGRDGICKCKCKCSDENYKTTPSNHSPPVVSTKQPFYTNTYSFVGTNSIAGIRCINGADILSIFHRADTPITYIGIIWSFADTVSKFNLQIKDSQNKVCKSIILGPATQVNSKHIHEIHLDTPIQFPVTQLLKFVIESTTSPCIYSIMIGYSQV